MGGINFKGFDVDALLGEIEKDVEKDLKKNPEKVLDFHIGEVVNGKCKKCGKTTIEILSKGKAKCTKCGTISKVDLDIKLTNH